MLDLQDEDHLVPRSVYIWTRSSREQHKNGDHGNNSGEERGKDKGPPRTQYITDAIKMED